MKSMDLSFLKKPFITIVVDWINFCIQNSRSLKFDHRVFHFERGPNPRYVKQINDSSTVLLVAGVDSLISTKIAVDAHKWRSRCQLLPIL